MGLDLLRSLGQRARARRLERGWTLREVAQRSGLSPRFLVQLEAGRGNISVRRLADLAKALDLLPEALIAMPKARGEPVVALLGLRGALAKRRSAAGSRAGCVRRSSSSIGESNRR